MRRRGDLNLSPIELKTQQQRRGHAPLSRAAAIGCKAVPGLGGCAPRFDDDVQCDILPEPPRPKLAPSPDTAHSDAIAL
ncbi:MAG: hypothetical protein Tsb0020_07360 [Haliangiales bacterium]